MSNILWQLVSENDENASFGRRLNILFSFFEQNSSSEVMEPLYANGFVC